MLVHVHIHCIYFWIVFLTKPTVYIHDTNFTLIKFRKIAQTSTAMVTIILHTCLL